MTKPSRKSSKSEGQRIYEAVKAVYPDIYICPGLGICGPHWQEAEKLRAMLTAEVTR